MDKVYIETSIVSFASTLTVAAESTLSLGRHLLRV